MSKIQGVPELQAVTDFLSRCLPFNTLGTAELNQIAQQLEIQYFRRGHVFVSDANHAQGLRILRSGAVEIRSTDGQLLDRLSETENFNLTGLTAEHEGLKAVAIEDSLIFRLPDEEFQQWRNLHRDFDRFFHSQRNRRIRRAARYEPNVHLMTRSVTELMCHDVLTTRPNYSVLKAAQAMSRRRVSSITVIDKGELVGILTDRDLRIRVVAEGLEPKTPVREVMTPTPFTIDKSATVFDATLEMTQRNCHHLPVMHNGKMIGIITASDLMLAKRDDSVYLVQHISRQQDMEGLQNVVTSLPNALQGWVKNGIRANQICRILTAISDSITRKLIELAESKLGPAPVPYAWLSFGSQARNEQLLGTNQHNGIIIDNKVEDEQLQWFKDMARYVCDGLHTCGYAYCDEDVMATNDDLRIKLSDWRISADGWINQATTENLRQNRIFFDLRVIHGDVSLGDQLQYHMLQQTRDNSQFLSTLADIVLEHTPPLGIFKRFLVERSGEHQDQFDLKTRGIMPIVDMIQVYALAYGVYKLNTRERIDELIEKKHISLTDGRNLQDALDYIMHLRVKNHADLVANGQNVDDYCNPKDLPDLSRQHLKDVFTIVHNAQEPIKDLFRKPSS